MTEEVDYRAKDDREKVGNITAKGNPIWNDRYNEDLTISGAKYKVLNGIFNNGIHNSTRIAREHSRAREVDENYQDRIIVLKEGLKMPGREELDQEEYLYALVNDLNEDNTEINLMMRISREDQGYQLHTVSPDCELLFDETNADVNIFNEEEVNELLEASGEPVKNRVRGRSTF